MHASCYIQGHVYVICGQQKQFECLNSIERLDCRNSNSSSWELIELPADKLIPRFQLAAAVINSKEILIFGGRDQS